MMRHLAYGATSRRCSHTTWTAAATGTADDRRTGHVDGQAPVNRALGFQLRRWFREVVSGMRSVTWPSRGAYAGNARIVAGVLGSIAVAIALLNVALGSAVASLVR